MDNGEKGTQALRARIEELEERNRRLLAEKEQIGNTDFAWAGNLGHWYFDLTAKTVTFNPLKAAALGYSMEELPSQVPYQFFTDKVHPDDFEPMMDAMRAHMYRKSPAYEAEYRIRTRSGSWKWFYDRGVATQWSASGAPTLIAGIVFDITQQKELEENLRLAKQQLESANAELLSHRDHLEELVHTRTLELAQARDAAESANRAKGAFLSMMSHEMRTPLNQIMGMTHLVAKSLSEGQVRQRLVVIEQSSKRLLGLINDMLDYTRAESETLSLDARNFRMEAVIAQVADGVREAVARKGLALALDVERSIPSVLLGDPERIAHVLRILVDNAVKYSEHGTVTMRARHAGKSAGGVVVRFEVEDQGIGIPEHRKAMLFRAFTQGDEGLTRRYEGLGLGLALAQRLVSLMGGTIEVESIEGEGSLFRFDLRLQIPQSAAASCADRPAGAYEQARQLAELMVTLLEMADMNVRSLWEESGPSLACLLGADQPAFDSAMREFDFETALGLLRSALERFQDT